MPIPTRSRSVRETKAPDQPAASTSAKVVSIDATRGSRLAQPKTTHLVPGHARSYSAATRSKQSSSAQTVTPGGLAPTKPSTFNKGTDDVEPTTSTNIPRQCSTPASTLGIPAPASRGAAARHVQRQLSSDRAANRAQATRTTGQPLLMDSNSLSSRSTSVPQTLKIKPPSNAYQQHFIPKKSVPTELREPADPRATSQVGDSYISALRQELTELSLVYQDANRTLVDYEHSAMETILDLNGALKGAEEVVDAQCRDRQKLINLCALRQWIVQDDGLVDESKVGKLSLCVRELASLTGPQGLFTKYQEEFETWLGHVESDSQTSEYRYVKPLSRDRAQQMRELRARVAMCIGVLVDLECGDELATCTAKSTLSYVISQHSQLARALQAYLDDSDAVVETIRALQDTSITSKVSEVMTGVHRKDPEPRQQVPWD